MGARSQRARGSPREGVSTAGGWTRLFPLRSNRGRGIKVTPCIGQVEVEEMCFWLLELKSEFGKVAGSNTNAQKSAAF